jgi:hypothetical protein
MVWIIRRLFYYIIANYNNMSKSLIRKNQLHPDISDLVSGYGTGFFVTPAQLDNAIDISQQIITQGAVLVSGNQTISGLKNFTTRPTLNGSGLATTGELGGSTTFNGNRAITRSSIDGVTPGGTDVVTFLNNLFYPFIPSTISLNSYSLRELGTTFSNVPYIGTITQNDESSISNLRFFSGNSLIFTSGSPNFGAFNYTSSVNLTGATILSGVLDTNNNGSPTTISSSRTVTFEAPTFAGSGIDNLQSNPANMKLVLSGQNFLGGNNGKTVMQEPSSFQVQVYTNNSWFYIVYPSGWGALTRIANPQLGDFNINTDFTQGFVTLSLDNGITTHPYRYYKRSLSTTLTNYPVIYYF